MNIVTLLYLICAFFSTRTLSSEVKQPTLVIAVLIRNKAHTLPYFLSLLENINYPKDRISLWLRSDHNIDNSIELLKLWIDNVHDQYHSISTNFVDDKQYVDEKGPAHWSPLRFKHVISLREEALNYARTIWADYFLAIDADAFLTEPNVLQELMSTDFTVVAPLLQSVGMYSNFWGAMTSDYYYERSEDYESIFYRKTTGCFKVPMVHSCVLINLKKVPSDRLTYVPQNIVDYDGPRDDIIAFSLSANKSGVNLHLCNEKVFGFIMVPLEDTDELEYDYYQLINLKLEVLVEQEPLPVNAIFKSFIELPRKDTLGFDKVYMINLLRREDRRHRMNLCFDELGLEVTRVNAVDGKLLTEKHMQNITFMSDYADPYHKRPMTLGEVGCFLSHYSIWKEVVKNQFKVILVLEDDIRFEPFFRAKVERLMDELNEIGDWDLVMSNSDLMSAGFRYLGRKRLQTQDEPFLQNSEMLVKVGYSYWTLGYVLTLQGAEKLLSAEPLTKILPVDEYFPILFDRHPNNQWKAHYPKRDLIAFSSAPLLLYPTHYTGEVGYVSDTEDSKVVNKAPPIRSDL